MSIEVITSGFKSVSLSPTWPQRLFGANSPNIIQWRWDGAGPVDSGSISDGLNTFSLLKPNADGVFSFDLSVFARAKLADLPDQSDREIPTAVFSVQEGLSVAVLPTFTVVVDGEAEVLVSDEEFLFIAAMRQGWNAKKASFFTECVTEVETAGVDEVSRVLLPTDNLMLFPGYPVDVSIYHYQFEGSEGRPYRLGRVLDGDVIGNSLEELPDTIEHEVLSIRTLDLPSGRELNILTTNTDGSRRVKRIVNLFSREGNGNGVFIRWLNDEGAYSYWLFDGIFLEIDDVQDNGSTQIFTSNPFTFATIKPLPKEVQRTIELSTSAIECWMFEHLRSLQWSRNVFIWKANKGNLTLGGGNAWQAVNVSSFTYSPEGGLVKEVFINLQPAQNYTPQI